MSKGYSMLSKELMDSEEYFSERFTRMQAYIDLCLLAAWKDRKFIKRGQVIELKAGQLAKSEEELAERWKWSRNTVRKYLNEQQIIGNIEQRKSRLITIITVKFGLNIEQQIEQQIPSKNAQQIEQQQEDIYKDNKDIEEESNDSKKNDELFESCWKAYRRKGSKAKALTYWKKLKEEEREKVMPHIQVYVSSREKQYQKDFERYLRDKTFNEIIVKGNDTIYDPLKVENPNDYHPLTDDVFQTWNEDRKCLRFNGDLNHLNDGYADDTRPDGAMVSWGMYSWKWSKELKKWVEA